MRFPTPFSRPEDPKVTALRRLPAFADAPRHEVEQAAATLDITEVEAGTELMHQGDRGLDLHLVIAGKALVTRDGRTVAVVGPGEFIGEAALLGDGHRNATVTAQTPLTVATTTRPYLAGMVSALPAFGRQLRETSVARLAA